MKPRYKQPTRLDMFWGDVMWRAHRARKESDVFLTGAGVGVFLTLAVLAAVGQLS